MYTLYPVTRAPFEVPLSVIVTGIQLTSRELAWPTATSTSKGGSGRPKIKTKLLKTTQSTAIVLKISLMFNITLMLHYGTVLRTLGKLQHTDLTKEPNQ